MMRLLGCWRVSLRLGAMGSPRTATASGTEDQGTTCNVKQYIFLKRELIPYLLPRACL
jgi:hypothetical protein